MSIKEKFDQWWKTIDHKVKVEWCEGPSALESRTFCVEIKVIKDELWEFIEDYLIELEDDKLVLNISFEEAFNKFLDNPRTKALFIERAM